MKYIALSLVLCKLFLSSCSSYYYAPALFRSDVAYVPKPASYDSIKTTIYVSGGLGTELGINLNDEITYGTIDLSAGHVFKSVNIAYGAFAYGGNIRNTNIREDSTDHYPLNSKGFTALGARFSTNLFTAGKRTNFRYLGFEATYSKEFGSYNDFRKAVNGIGNHYAITGTDLLTMGLSSEIIWRNRRAQYTQFGIRVFLGGRYLNYKFSDADVYRSSTKSGHFDLAYFMKYKRYIGSVNTNLLSSAALRLGYNF
jgi:hypothetical protein